jgi:hypothetical protein
MLKQKNSSLTMLLDSTNSMMRTASTTLQRLMGSNRRASYCGEFDPTIQLSPNGNSGSLYLLPTGAHSNESSLSNVSCEDQRRTVTIYDGRIPVAPAAPTIPFELMTPIDAITQTIDDPVESFVQIVLEEPDDRPSVMQTLSSSRRNSSSRHRHRSCSPNLSSNNERLSTVDNKSTDRQSLPVTDLFNSSEIYSKPPEVVEPMDFSFLEPVLRGESAAPPPVRLHNSQKTSLSENSATDVRPPSRTITIIRDDITLPDLSSHDYSTISSSCLRVPSSID